MTSASIICLGRDVDSILEALNEFGEFHIEQTTETTTLAQYDLEIQKTQQTLFDINEISKHLAPQKTSPMELFKTEKPIQTHVTAENWQTLQEKTSKETAQLKKETETLTAATARLHEKTAELNHIQNMLTIMGRMGADLAAMEEMQLIRVAIASVPSKNLPDLEKALTGFPLVFHRCYLEKNTEFVCLSFPSKHQKDAEKILKTHHGEIFTVPADLPHNVDEALKEVNRQLTQNAAEAKKTQETFLQLGEENRGRLVSLGETAQNIFALLSAKRKILQSGRLATVTGFVPKTKLVALKEKVNSALKENTIILENEVAPAADPPTLIRNNRFVKPFEEITNLYGLPHYDELDPTPLIAISFPLIFGLMFGDVGHGLILLVGGLTLGFLIKKQSAIKNICWIMAACGVGAVFAGLLFGEFFGKQLFAPLWFNPFDNVLSFLIFSLFVGVAQIVSGLVLEMVDYLIRRNVADALLTSVPKIAFYAGSVYLITAYQLNFGAWFAGPILFALVPFLVLVFGKTLAYRFAGFSAGAVEVPQEKVSLGERFFESGDFVARLMSNTMSYTRILALLMAHWALILVVYVIAGLVGSGSILTTVVGGIIIVAGNIFVIALEGLIVFIHSLRLHFYEWFSKFYQGSGTPFSPFKQNFVYTKVVLGEENAEKRL